MEAERVKVARGATAVAPHRASAEAPLAVYTPRVQPSKLLSVAAMVGGVLTPGEFNPLGPTHTDRAARGAAAPRVTPIQGYWEQGKEHGEPMAPCPTHVVEASPSMALPAAAVTYRG